MADEKQPTTEQARLAREVLAGEREITASAPKENNMPNIPDDAKRQAAMLAADNKLMAAANKTLQAEPESKLGTETPPMSSPGFSPKYGESGSPTPKAPTPEPDKG